MQGQTDPSRPTELDAEGFAELGVTVESEGDDVPKIWDINGEAWHLFLDVSSQWRCHVVGTTLVWLGLDYVAVDVVMRRRNLADRLFHDLQAMEEAAITAFAGGAAV